MSKLSPDFYAFLEKGLRRIDRRDDTGQHQPCLYTSTLLFQFYSNECTFQSDAQGLPHFLIVSHCAISVIGSEQEVHELPSCCCLH